MQAQLTGQDGGKLAPLNILEEFLNTLDLRRFGPHGTKDAEARESWQTPGQLDLWLRARGLGADDDLGNPALRLARTVRDTLRAQLAARDVGTAGLPEASEPFPRLAFKIALIDAVPELLPLEPNAGMMRWLVSVLLSAAATGRLARLKICSSPDCLWAFVDESRNGLGKWCSMDVCGNRHKLRSYRSRLRESNLQAPDRRSSAKRPRKLLLPDGKDS